jgi:hypothetical protein
MGSNVALITTSLPFGPDRQSAYCYNDAGVIKRMWENVKCGFRGGMRSFED